MSRATQRRRVTAWIRYTARYIRPPHGALGCVMPMGEHRAVLRLGRYRATPQELITFRQYRRTT